MKTDVEIAQEAQMQPVYKIAEKLGITEDELELYGKYKAKIALEAWERVKDRPNGKLVLVTAINPTPAGEGKTTTSPTLRFSVFRYRHQVNVKHKVAVCRDVFRRTISPISHLGRYH